MAAIARINFESSLKSDPRFIKLMHLLGLDTSHGAMVRVWEVAQVYWKKGKLPIPIREWQKHELNKAVLDVGLAKIITPELLEQSEHLKHLDQSHVGSVYVCGSEENFAWLLERAESGRKGGLKAGASKRKQKLANEANSSKLSKTYPHSLSHSPSQEENTNLSHDCDEVDPLELIYREYPKRKGGTQKSKGIQKIKSLLKAGEDINEVFKSVRGYANYIRAEQKEKTGFVKMFSTFFDAHGDWKEWANLDTGTDTIELSDEEFQKAAFGGEVSADE